MVLAVWSGTAAKDTFVSGLVVKTMRCSPRVCPHLQDSSGLIHPELATLLKGLSQLKMRPVNRIAIKKSFHPIENYIFEGIGKLVIDDVLVNFLLELFGVGSPPGTRGTGGEPGGTSTSGMNFLTPLSHLGCP